MNKERLINTLLVLGVFIGISLALFSSIRDTNFDDSKDWAARGTAVRSVIAATGPNASSPPFTVKVVEQQFRSTFPDTGLPDKRLSATRNLNYLKEPTTNRLARGIRGNTDTSDPRVSGIVFEKMENRKAGQMDIPTADGKSWSEPKVPWAAIYPYNHVHQFEI